MNIRDLRTTGTIWVFGIWLAVCSAAVPLAARMYQEGLKDARAQNWQLAITALRASYAHKPGAITAYVLSACYEHLYKYERALRFAMIALKARPALPKRYRSVAENIRIWAQGALYQPSEKSSEVFETTTVEGLQNRTTDTGMQQYMIDRKELGTNRKKKCRDEMYANPEGFYENSGDPDCRSYLNEYSQITMGITEFPFLGPHGLSLNPLSPGPSTPLPRN